MAQRRRLAHGSSTSEHQLQRAAIQTVDAHLQVQEAAHKVSADLDELPLIAGAPTALEQDDSMVIVLKRAKRAVKA